VYLATHADVRPMDRFRTFQIASGIFLAAYVLGHMNSVFVFARLYLGIDSDWAFATGAPAGLVKDAWNIRLVPHYGLGVFFVLSHLAAGVRALMLSHDVARRYADRFLIGGAMAAGLVAFAIMFGMCGARLSFVTP
jgi:succinate dehydrogenase hydrophobic anchor subunit